MRPGEALGKLTVGLGVATATGLAGEVVLRRVRFDDDQTGDPIAVAAIAPGVRRTVEGEPWLRFQMQGVRPWTTPFFATSAMSGPGVITITAATEANASVCLSTPRYLEHGLARARSPGGAR